MYPLSYWLFVLGTGCVAIFWTLDYFLVVAPALRAHMGLAAASGDDPRWRMCYFDDQYAMGACAAITACFFLFVTVRGLVCVKPIGRRLQAARRGQLGPAMRHAAIVAMQCPLLLFAVGTLLFNIREQVRHEECKDHRLVAALRRFGCYSLLLVLLSCLALLWNAMLRTGGVPEAQGSRSEKMKRRAPPGILARIPTVPYDPELFGAEDGRRYHGECSICLEDFEAEHAIKDVTHALEAEAEGTDSGTDVVAEREALAAVAEAELARLASERGAAAAAPSREAECARLAADLDAAPTFPSQERTQNRAEGPGGGRRQAPRGVAAEVAPAAPAAAGGAGGASRAAVAECEALEARADSLCASGRELVSVLLGAVFRRHAPERVAEVPALMDSAHHAEPKLLERVVLEYVAGGGRAHGAPPVGAQRAERGVGSGPPVA
ncbi:unnamed protein product, partial [Prorocentrum cordatum]